MVIKKYVFPTLLLLGTGFCASAHPPHNEGVHLASEIIGLVRAVFSPAPRVVVQAPPPPPPPAPVVVIPEYGYGWWQGVWVPRWGDWYWHHGCWVWGGRGLRPVPPAWAPDFHRRPMPPPPPRPPAYHHHRPAPPPPPAYRHHPAPPPPRHPAPPRGHHGRRW